MWHKSCRGRCCLLKVIECKCRTRLGWDRDGKVASWNFVSILHFFELIYLARFGIVILEMLPLGIHYLYYEQRRPQAYGVWQGPRWTCTAGDNLLLTYLRKVVWTAASLTLRYWDPTLNTRIYLTMLLELTSFSCFLTVFLIGFHSRPQCRGQLLENLQECSGKSYKKSAFSQLKTNKNFLSMLNAVWQRF